VFFDYSRKMEVIESFNSYETLKISSPFVEATLFGVSLPEKNKRDIIQLTTEKCEECVRMKYVIKFRKSNIRDNSASVVVIDNRVHCYSLKKGLVAALVIRANSSKLYAFSENDFISPYMHVASIGVFVDMGTFCKINLTLTVPNEIHQSDLYRTDSINSSPAHVYAEMMYYHSLYSRYRNFVYTQEKMEKLALEFWGIGSIAKCSPDYNDLFNPDDLFEEFSSHVEELYYTEKSECDGMSLEEIWCS
jgi:hypothetical protein